MMKMRRPKFAFSEKRFLWLSTLLCAVPLGLSGLYEWNNRVPDVALLPRVIPKPNSEDWFLKATTLYVPPVPNTVITGGGVDWLFDDKPPLPVPTSYTTDYNRIYPLARKRAFLRVNAAALDTLRRGIPFRHGHQPMGYRESDHYWSQLRSLTRLLLVEAHARAQQNDWHGAVNSLLTAYHLGCVSPQEAPADGLFSASQFRATTRFDFWALAPHLSAQESRYAARKIESDLLNVPSLSRSLSWEKRDHQELLLRLIKKRDFRPLYLGFEDCISGAACGISRADMDQQMSALPPLLQMQLSWMNKPQLMTKLISHMDWEIAEASKPYPQRERAQNWPDSIPNDNLDLLIHESHFWVTRVYARNQAQDALLLTSLAIRAFRLEKGRNPQNLSELVPLYLAHVPLDPFSNNAPLRYKNQPKKFMVSGFELDVEVSPLGQPVPPSPAASARPLRRYETVPFTLYSLGYNAHDDGGTPYEDKDQKEKRRRYQVANHANATAADIVAGINN